MTVAVTARTAGRVTLNVIGDRLISSTSRQEVQAGTQRMRVPVGRDWGNGAYVVATLRRPLDAKAQRMPGRAIGVQWFSIDRKAQDAGGRHERCRSCSGRTRTLRVPVKIDGLAAGEEARIVVAAVDVGILNLTNYKPPAPDDYYLGQRRLTAELRDLYGQLIDGMQGTRGQIRTGGDAGAELSGSPPSQAPLALYSGIVTVKPDGTAEVVVRHPGVRRHRARHGGGLEQGQGRPRHRRRHRARSGGADRDACRASCSPATAAPCTSTSTTSKARPATTAVAVQRRGRGRHRRAGGARACGCAPSSAPA